MGKENKGGSFVSDARAIVMYLVYCSIFLLMIYLGKLIISKKYVYEDYPLKVNEAKRFFFDGDTIIVLLIEYDGKDYIVTKIKSEK